MGGGKGGSDGVGFKHRKHATLPHQSGKQLPQSQQQTPNASQLAPLSHLRYGCHDSASCEE
jgi:hypothetical protein